MMNTLQRPHAPLVLGFAFLILADVAPIGGAGCDCGGGTSANVLGDPCTTDDDCGDFACCFERCNTGSYCEFTECEVPGDCGSGKTCTVDGVCEGPGKPIIAVTPLIVDFGQVALAVETQRQVTVSNSGDEDLNITGVQIIESDVVHTNVEFGATPSGDLGASPIVIAPGASAFIDLTLTPADDEVDQGVLRITSNDPDQPTVDASLTSTL